MEELCGTNSRFLSFSEKILSGDFCDVTDDLYSEYEADLHTEHKDSVSSEPGPRKLILKIFTEYFVVCPVELKE